MSPFAPEARFTNAKILAKTPHLLPDFPEAHRARKQRVHHDIQLLAVPEPPLAGVRDLDRLRLHVLLLAVPTGEASSRVVPQAQPHLKQVTGHTRAITSLDHTSMRS